jgi:phage replication O-like protein O
MSSTETGFTKVPHGILEALARICLGSYEMRVVLFVIRKTYGWHKEVDWISLSQISEGTGIAKSNVSRTIKSLALKNIIIRPDSRHLGLQEDYLLWCDRLSDRVSKEIMEVI